MKKILVLVGVAGVVISCSGAIDGSPPSSADAGPDGDVGDPKDGAVEAGDAVADAPSDAPLSDTGPHAEPVKCGDLTCSATQYCYSKCTCCGIPIGDSGLKPSGTFECRPLPTGCTAEKFCNCKEATVPGGWCDAKNRTTWILCE